MQEFQAWLPTTARRFASTRCLPIALLQLLAEDAPVAICVVTGGAQRVELANAACRALSGMARPVGATLNALLPACAAALTSAEAQDHLRTGRLWTMRTWSADPDCVSRAWTWLAWSPLIGSRVVLLGFDATKDLADMRAAAREAAEAKREVRAKDDLVWQLLHELRGPLAPIRTALEVLRAADPPAHARAVAVLERQIKHLARLINDLSDLNGAIHSGLMLSREWVELAAIVEQALEVSAPALSTRGHEVHIDVAAGLLLWVDAARIIQVIANLVANAAKYTDPGGSIRITAQRVADEVVLCVRDNGIGIPPDVLPKVFEMFVRGPRARSVSEGVGLGLYIVKALVRQHDGSIEARSEGPGRGSEFIVRLPCGSAPV